MALEQPPPRLENLSLESLKNYRPSDGGVYTWHIVANGMQENFATISAKYQIPVNYIIEFNFPGSVKANRIIPQIVNWYLHYHIGFNCPETHDKKNRIFKGGEQIAIPFQGNSRWNVTKITYLNQENDIIPLPFKFVGGFDLPKKAFNVGYFLFRFKIGYEGELIRKNCRSKISVSAKEIKVSVEEKWHIFETDFSSGIAVKAKKFSTKELADLLQDKTTDSFAKKMAHIFSVPVEISLKKTFKIDKNDNKNRHFPDTVTPEFRLDLTKRDSGPDKGGTGLPMPAIIRCQFGYSDTIRFSFDKGEEKKFYKYFFDCKIAATIEVSIGLSPKGWEMAYQIGRQVATRLVAALGAEGVLAAIIPFAVAIPLNFAFTYFVAWCTADVRRKGQAKGLEFLYATAYVHKVFGDKVSGNLRDSISNGDPLRDVKTSLVELGEKDAVADARKLLQKSKHPQANGTDKQVLYAYMWILIEQNGGDYNKHFNAAYSQLKELVVKNIKVHL